LRESALDGVSYKEEFATVRLQHAFEDAVIEEGKELVIETVDVEQENWFCVKFQGMPGEYLEELFKGAEATGQSDEGVGAFSNEGLASVHRAGDVKLGEAAVGHFEVN
jgi:hypothetical protein